MTIKTNAELHNRWGSVINEGDNNLSTEVKNVTARILENTTEKGENQKKMHVDTTTGQISESRETLLEAGTDSANLDFQDPILVSMVRRLMPSLIAFDIVGVQPMTGPTGLLFAIKSWYNTKEDGNEALGIGEPNKDFTGPYGTAAGEELGVSDQVNVGAPGQTPVDQVAPWPEMEFSIEQTSVTAETRALKARYTRELAQDLKATHGLDAEMELANMMVGEIRSEMNREMVFKINEAAKVGAQNLNGQNVVATTGTYDLNADSDGRWSVEKYKELMTFIHRESQVVARQTRRGLANFIITSADVAAALTEASRLDTTFATQGLSFDGVGITYAGLLQGRFKLYIDSYAPSNYITLGYKGQTSYDAGLIWAPYVGLERMSAIGEEDFQPRLGYKTRYGIANNPFVEGTGPGQNQYYRRFTVANL